MRPSPPVDPPPASARPLGAWSPALTSTSSPVHEWQHRWEELKEQADAAKRAHAEEQAAQEELERATRAGADLEARASSSRARERLSRHLAFLRGWHDQLRGRVQVAARKVETAADELRQHEAAPTRPDQGKICTGKGGQWNESSVGMTIVDLSCAADEWCPEGKKCYCGRDRIIQGGNFCVGI